MATKTTSTALTNRSPKYLASVPAMICIVVTSRRNEASAQTLGERSEPVGNERRGFNDQAAAYDIQASANRSGQSQILQREHPGDGSAEDGRGKSNQAQQGNATDCAKHRQCAAPAGCTGGAQVGIGDDDECERVKRRHYAVVQFGPELARLLYVRRVLRIRKQQLPEVTLADRVFGRLRSASELR